MSANGMVPVKRLFWLRRSHSNGITFADSLVVVIVSLVFINCASGGIGRTPENEFSSPSNRAKLVDVNVGRVPINMFLDIPKYHKEGIGVSTGASPARSKKGKSLDWTNWAGRDPVIEFIRKSRHDN